MKARLPKGVGGGGIGNMQQLMRQAQKMQEQMESVSEELQVKEYSAVSGGGMVTAVVTGKMEIKSIEIKPEIVDPDDTEMLSDVIMAAVNEALRKATEDKDERMGDLSNGLSLPGLF